MNLDLASIPSKFDDFDGYYSARLHGTEFARFAPSPAWTKFADSLEGNGNFSYAYVLKDDSDNEIKGDRCYSFLYRLLLNGKPVEELRASEWRLHVVTSKSERDAIMDHYQDHFWNEPNKCWQIIPVELPA